jgi:hypothetical protein
MGKWLKEVLSSNTKVKRDLSVLALAGKCDSVKQAANAEQPINHWRRCIEKRSVICESDMLMSISIYWI